jgi:hypothetical protein
MTGVTVHWVGIVVAVVAAMAIGAIWYGPLFSKQWMAYLGKTREEMQGQGAALGYGFAILGSFVTAIVLTYVTQWAGAGGSFGQGMLTGMVVWAGFALSTGVTGGIFEGKPWGLLLINAGNWLLTFMVVGGIVAAFAK